MILFKILPRKHSLKFTYFLKTLCYNIFLLQKYGLFVFYCVVDNFMHILIYLSSTLVCRPLNLFFVNKIDRLLYEACDLVWGMGRKLDLFPSQLLLALGIFTMGYLIIHIYKCWCASNPSAIEEVTPKHPREVGLLCYTASARHS